ncbi:MAG: hypothetical protein AAF280_14835 [Pseudomonadota bacterium]
MSTAQTLKRSIGAPSAQLVSNARQVVANPEQYYDRPLLRRMAWMTLMSARGRAVDQLRLAQMPVEVAT